MKKSIVVLLIVICYNSFSQSTTAWEKWSWLIGEWEGEGSGQPGQGTGSFSFRLDLDNKILTRRNFASYPATKERPSFHHEDVMMVYPATNSAKAIYFDNEGHVINYSVTVTDNVIVFLGDKVQGAPVFRLTYARSDSKKVAIKFEISSDGENFKMYIEAAARKKV